jgi:hypothetical protein
MSSLNAFRITGTNTSVPPGCYDFGGTVHADFYLKLYADTGGCIGPCSVWAPFCIDGVDTTITCPCGNFPAGSGLGCDNFGTCACDPKSGTLEASGVAEAEVVNAFETACT